MRWVEEHGASRNTVCSQGLLGLSSVLSVGLHGLLILACVLAGMAGMEAQDLINPVTYEVSLVTLKNAGGTGHSAAQLARVERVTSPLPAAPTPPKVEATKPETPAKAPLKAVAKKRDAPRPIASAAAKTEAKPPAPVAEAAKEDAAAPRDGAEAAPQEESGGQAAASGEGNGAAAGLTHPQGMPKGVGDALGRGELSGGIGEVDVLPRILRKVEPRYPHGARQRGVTGTVSVRFLVDDRGRVCDPCVISARPEGIFEDSALAAVRRWKFSAARKGGRPVATWVVLPIRFSLQ